MAEDRYNRRNPAVKRILQEVKEMQANPSDDFQSLPLEDNIFEWQFAILGPRDTEFEGGIYHGRIQLPAEYPFKPPSFMFLTPNGRFETQTKICLSISNYHPEHWQPSWSVRTALVALIAFMSTNPNGALGSLDYNKEVRRELAIKSRETAPTYGNSERQMLIDEIHQYLLNKAPSVPQLLPNPTTESSDSTVGEIDAIPDAISATEDQQMEDRVVEAENEADAIAHAGRQSVSSTTEMRSGMPTVEVSEQPQRPRVQQSFQDRALTWAAIWLAIAILILLMKKFLKSKIVAESISGF